MARAPTVGARPNSSAARAAEGLMMRRMCGTGRRGGPTRSRPAGAGDRVAHTRLRPVTDQGWARPQRPSRARVGRMVGAKLVVELLQQPARVVVEATVAGAGGVAGEGAAAHRRRPAKVLDATATVGGVAGEGAVAHRQIGGEVV